MQTILEKLLETAKKISSDKKFLSDVHAFSNIDGYIGLEKPFKSTIECRQFLINEIENGTIQTKEEFYKLFGCEIINCASGEIIARL